MIRLPLAGRLENQSSVSKLLDAVIVLAGAIIFISQLFPFIDILRTGEISWGQWLWGIAVGLQILLTKAFRIPIAPGKWADFTYVPLWLLAFTLPGPFSFMLLVLFFLLVYFVFPNQFFCKKTLPAYFFHMAYQMLLFFVTIEAFWWSANHWEYSLGSLHLTGTIAMFVSMFALMLTDTFVGGLIQKLEGQSSVLKEWLRDYLRITLLQTLLSTAAMYFAVLYLTGHPVELAVTYLFFLLVIGVLYRYSLRAADYAGLMVSFANLVEIKDTYTKNHSQSVGHYTVILGQMAGWNASRLDRLKMAGELHDLGKIGIPDEVLKKQGKLTDEEYEIMKTHAALGEKVLEPIGAMRKIAHIVGRHHEHLNGKGYPYGISGDHIPTEARMICIADAYHAMISNRPYRKGLPVKEALNRLREASGSQFDPELVQLFCSYVENPSRHQYRFRPFCLVH